MANLKYQKIFVTGGTGLVGSHLTEALLNEKAQIIIPARSFNPYSYFSQNNLGSQVIQVTADLKNFPRLLEIITRYEIDYIIHLGAQALVETAYVNPLETLNTNIIGTANLLEAARLSGRVKGIIVASSDKAYGKLKKAKYSELDPLKGDHPYEVSKSAADLIAQMYYRTYGLPVVVTRFGNIYGPGDLNFSRLIPDICRSLCLGKKLLIRSDGTYRRDYLYVKDVVAGYMAIINKLRQVVGECFNFGSTETLSVLELIKKIQTITHQTINYQILNQQHNEIPYQSLNFTKAKKLLSWKPENSLVKTFPTTLAWYQRFFKS